MHDNHRYTVTGGRDDYDPRDIILEIISKEEWQPVTMSEAALPEIDDPPLPPYLVRLDLQGVREASMRHDALARRRYVKPFKWFKFNRARKATAK